MERKRSEVYAVLQLRSALGLLRGISNVEMNSK